MISLRKISYTLAAATALLVAACTGVTPGTSPNQLRPSYLAMEAYSGRVLYASDANVRRPIGMLANLMTATIVLDWMQQRSVSMDRMVRVPVEVLEAPKTNLLNLRPGDWISLRDALYSCLMWDDSGCAITLAHACGSVLNPRDPLGAFTVQMNNLATKSLGMVATHFKGPSGSVVSHSTVQDLARLTLYALDNTTLRSICSQRTATVTINGFNGITRTQQVVNSNLLLSRGDSVEGVKAARSASAGSCLIASIRRASVKRLNPLTGKQSTYPQRMIIIMLGVHTPQQRYQLGDRLLQDGWHAWDAWQQTSDYHDTSKFIILKEPVQTH